MCVFRAQSRAGRGVLRSSSDRDDRMGKKSKPSKIPRALNKTQRTPGPKFNQQKSPVSGHKNFQEELNNVTIMNLQIVLHTENNPYLNQASQ